MHVGRQHGELAVDMTGQQPGDLHKDLGDQPAGVLVAAGEGARRAVVSAGWEGRVQLVAAEVRATMEGC